MTVQMSRTMSIVAQNRYGKIIQIDRRAYSLDLDLEQIRIELLQKIRISQFTPTMRMICLRRMICNPAEIAIMMGKIQIFQSLQRRPNDGYSLHNQKSLWNLVCNVYSFNVTNIMFFKRPLSTIFTIQSVPFSNVALGRMHIRIG